MLEWPKTLRFERIANAAEALAKGGQRWQRALQLDPAKFARVQGKATAQPVLRVGLARESKEHFARLVAAVYGHAAVRVLPWTEESKRDRLTLHAWADGIRLDRPRWGGVYRNYLPDTHIAAPVDAVVWKQLQEGVAVSRDAWAAVADLFKATAGADEPRARLLALALSRSTPQFPPAWGDPELDGVAVLGREAMASLWRRFLGGGPADVLLAEGLTANVGTIRLPEAIDAALEKEQRGWGERATPFSRAVEPWTTWIGAYDDDLLEGAWQDSLRDAAASALLLALLRSEKSVEPAAVDLWARHAAIDDSSPLFDTLRKVDEAAHEALLRRIKDHSGRFKGKARRHGGAVYLAKLCVLKSFDRWAMALLESTLEHVELGPDDPARIDEEARRGALYAFLPGAAIPSASAASGKAPAASATAHRTGHLFADLKGFTSITERLKEVEVRQFLRQNFYGPLLELAKGMFKGGVDMDDRGGVRLNNLLGDALSLCGSVSDLLTFAERATRLVQQDAAAAIREALRAESERELAPRRAALEQELADLKVRRAKGEGDVEQLEARLVAVAAELRRTPTATAEPPVELNCGFFVSYGAAPIDLEFHDDIFGHVYVALAEKINESARGCARSPAVEAALHALAARFPDRTWAFRVHVGPEISGIWPEELLDAWPTNPDEVGTLAQSLPGAIRFGGQTALYNVGIALSSESACDLVEQSKGQIKIWEGRSADLLRKTDPRALIAEPRQMLILVDVGEGPRVLRRCGRVAMKGFRVPPLVWEWVGPTLRLHKALVELLIQDGKVVTLDDVRRRLSDG